MTGSSESTLRRDAAENRRRLLESARVVFAEHGIEAGVEEVAHHAGVGIGTLYRRFPTKDALIGELVRELLEQTIALAKTAKAATGGDGLEQFLYAAGDAQAANRGCLLRLWWDDSTVLLRQECRVEVAELLADAQRHDRIRGDATLSDIDLMFWSLRGVLEANASEAPAAWERQISINIAGLRPSGEVLYAYTPR